MLPKSVKIGAYHYPVRIEEKVTGSQGEELWGYWHSFPDHYISVLKGTSPERQLAILIHEAIHGIDEAWDIGLKERQVRRLGTGLTTFLADNNLLDKRLLQPEKDE